MEAIAAHNVDIMKPLTNAEIKPLIHCLAQRERFSCLTFGLNTYRKPTSAMRKPRQQNWNGTSA